MQVEDGYNDCIYHIGAIAWGPKVLVPFGKKGSNKLVFNSDASKYKGFGVQCASTECHKWMCEKY